MSQVTLRRAAAIVVFVATAAACGGDDSGSEPSPAVDTTFEDTADDTLETPAASASDADGSGVDGSTADVDCDYLRSDDAAQAFLSIQVLGQLRDQSAVDSVEDTGLYDPDRLDRLLAAAGDLPEADGGGDPRAAADDYAATNDIGRRIVMTDGEVPVELFDEFIEQAGPVQDFLLGQVPISLAINESCPG